MSLWWGFTFPACTYPPLSQEDGISGEATLSGVFPLLLFLLQTLRWFVASPDPVFSREAGMILPLQGPTVHIPPFLPSPFFPPATHFEQAIPCQKRPAAHTPKERSCRVRDSWARSAPSWAVQTVTSCWDQRSLQLCLEGAPGS